MRGWWSGGRVLGGLLLALLSLATPVRAQTVVEPKIVLQTLPQTIDIAAWTPDDRFLLTASGTTRAFLIWDVANGLILDQLRLPAAPDSEFAEMMRLTAMEVSPDGRTALISGVVSALGQGGAPVGRSYSIDLATRAITMLPPRPVGGGNAIEDVGRWILALGVISTDEPEPEMSIADAIRLLPSLPGSHNGRYALRRTKDGFDILEGRRKVPLKVRAAPKNIDDAALAPDGRRVAFIRASDDEDNTVIEIFDTLTARYGKPTALAGDYGTVRWLSNTEFYAFAGTVYDDPETDSDIDGVPPPLVIVDATTGNVRQEIAPRCYIASIGDGYFVGAGLANCRTNAGTDRGLSMYDPTERKWDKSEVVHDKREKITHVAAHQGSGRLAIATIRPNGSPTLSIYETEEGDLDVAREFPSTSIIAHVQFSPDGKQLYVGGNGGAAIWDLASDSIKDLAAPSLAPLHFASDARTLLYAGWIDDSIARSDIATGKALAPLDFSNTLASGFLPGRPIFWSISAVTGLRLWDTRDWSVLLSTYFFEGRKFLAVAPDGRYDTDLGPDAAQFRWLVSDAKDQSLPPQTFIRDRFEPRLSQKLIDCTTARNCPRVLKPLPPIATLNRALPVTRITGVEPGEEPGTVEVSFEVTEGEQNGRRSGVYNPRLFRDNRFAGHDPDKAFEITETLEQWRALNRRTPLEDGTHRWTFIQQIPTLGPDKIEFSAYAFNEDRVKGDTATFTYTRPAMTRRTPRAFVVTIGIDAYDEPRLELNYAVADAALIADRLARIPGYEMRHTMLAGARRADGSVQPVTRDMIDTAFGALAGFPPGPQIERLRAMGIPADRINLDNVTPDDIVIISFSGHGWADAKGNFFLVPSDGKWAVGDPTPEADTLVSAATLTMWLRAIAASEIAFIIDACHSGASVDSGNFKPGPMGDPGLGQLAFDKGLRILAATQANDVALESSNLKQGLLTAALGEGLTASGGPADLDTNGAITLDEWLRFAVQRLPSLASGIGLSRGFAITRRPTATGKAAVQEPALFDFTNAASPVVLRGARR